MQNKKIVAGSLHIKTKIDGTIHSTKIVGLIKTAAVKNYDALLEKYEGPFESTPTFSEQHLYTKNKKMPEDVVIHAIPYYEVDNESEGKTIIIGG